MAKRQPGFADVVKKRVIMAMFSDDELMDRLVLKGGNLLDIVYGVSVRASVDVDFSVDGDLGDASALRIRIERALKSTFIEVNYEVFDVNARRVPADLTAGLKDFWGGYQVDFKIIERHLFQQWKGDVEKIRRNAASVGRRGSTKFEIEISNHEYCDPKEAVELGRLRIYVYTPLMTVCEKLRAICQQMPEYAQMVKRHRAARARDFVDIHTLAERFQIDLGADGVAQVLPKVFAAKRVPLRLMARIPDEREFHRPDFEAVKATVKAGIGLKESHFPQF
jgi:predicted nucleotidyltransferase component of viral defense system